MIKSYFQGKKIVVGVTAGAAIYKSLDLIRSLKKQGADVYPVMTRNAATLISPQLFSAISGNPALAEMFSVESEMGHINLQDMDAICVVPATANLIGKVVNGLADDLLTTTILASSAPILIAPAMNDTMWGKSVVQENVCKLRDMDVTICGPDVGEMACGSCGEGRMADALEILAYLERLFVPKTLKHKKVLVTAGPTREFIDDVRYITNRSSGHMGYSIAKEAWLRGAEVTLISGPVGLTDPYDMNIVKVQTADQMFAAVRSTFHECDYFFSVAAVSDFKPEKSKGKISKADGPLQVTLVQNPDVLEWCAGNKSVGQTVIGFALEDGYLMERTHQKLIRKKCDFMIGNGLGNMETEGGYAVFMYQSGVYKDLTGSKSELAKQIFDLIVH